MSNNREIADIDTAKLDAIEAGATADQTSIVGITGTIAEFNTAVTNDTLGSLGATQTWTGVNTFTTVSAVPTAPLPANGVDTFGLRTSGSYGGGIGITDGTGDIGLWGLTTGTELHIGFGTSGGALTTVANINNAGNLDLNGTVKADGRSYFTGASENFSVYLQYNAATSGMYLGATSGGNFQVSTAGGASALNVNADRSVDIPGGNLTVTGTGTFEGTSAVANKSIRLSSPRSFGAGDDAGVMIWGDGGNDEAHDLGAIEFRTGQSNKGDGGRGEVNIYAGGASSSRASANLFATFAYNNVGQDLITFRADDTDIVDITSTGLTVTGNLSVSGQYIEEYAATGTSGAITIDLNTGNNFSTALAGAVTYTFSNPATSGKVSSFTLKVVNNGSAITWPASVKWVGGVAPALSANTEIDIFSFYTHDAGTTWYGFISGQNMS
jgi:hypothetical protein